MNRSNFRNRKSELRKWASFVLALPMAAVAIFTVGVACHGPMPSFCDLHTQMDRPACEIHCPCDNGHGDIDLTQQDDPSCPMVSMTPSSQSARAALLANAAEAAVKGANSAIPTTAATIGLNGNGFNGDPTKDHSQDAAIQAAMAALHVPPGAGSHSSCTAQGFSDQACTNAGFATAGNREKTEKSPLVKTGPQNNASAPKVATLNAGFGGSQGGGDTKVNLSGGFGGDGVGAAPTEPAAVNNGTGAFDSGIKGAQGRGGFGDSEVSPGSRGGGGFGGGTGGDIVGPGSGGPDTGDTYLKSVGSVSLFEVVSGRYNVWSTKNKRSPGKR